MVLLVRGGDLEHAERAEGVEIGLRVLIGKRQACVSASDISHDMMGEVADRAVAMARIAPEDPFIGLADPGAHPPGRDQRFLGRVCAVEPRALLRRHHRRRHEDGA